MSNNVSYVEMERRLADALEYKATHPSEVMEGERRCNILLNITDGSGNNSSRKAW